MKHYVAIAFQSGKEWSKHALIALDEVPNVTTDNTKSWFTTPYKLALDKEPPKDTELTQLFEQTPKSADFYLDFDHESDITLAAADCYQVYTHLKNVVKVPEECMKVYYSGNKGFHLLVQWGATGLQPRTDLHKLYKNVAKALRESYCNNKTLDLKVYNARRMFRLPGFPHQKTGNKKVLIEPKHLLLVGSPGLPMKELADSPWKPTTPYAMLSEVFRRHERAEAFENFRKKRLPKQFLDLPLDCVQHALTNGLDEGMRNDGIYTIALYFKACGLTKTETKDRIASSALEKGMQKQEISSTVTSAFSSENRFGLKDNVLKDYITERDEQRWSDANLDENYVSFSEVVKNIEDGYKNPKSCRAKYHVPSLDARLGGIDSGELVVLGGSTGTGKSEFALHVAYENAKAGVPAAFITLELTNELIASRLVKSSAGLPPERAAAGDLTPEELEKLYEACEQFAEMNLPLFFREKKGEISVNELEALISSLIVEQGCQLIVLDHLHYMGGRNGFEKENVHVANSIRAVNTLCQKYGVGFICVAHFRKMPHNDHVPSIHEFRDSSAIEQEASTILIMKRNMQGFGREQCITDFHLGKTRKDLPLSVIRTVFNKDTRQYEPDTGATP